MTFKRTFNFISYRVAAIDIVEHADSTAQITVTATRVKRPGKVQTFEFFVGHGRRKCGSDRFQALMVALGVRRRPEDTDEMVGRYFAVKDGGKSADDFATIEYASACLRADHEKYSGMLKYLTGCAAEVADDLAA